AGSTRSQAASSRLTSSSPPLRFGDSPELKFVGGHPRPAVWGGPPSRSRRDSNPRPPAGQAGASSRLHHAPLCCHYSTRRACIDPHGVRVLCTPNGIRTRAATLKGWCPRPLDDGGRASSS